MAKKEVFKIQRPLMTNHAVPHVLVYNESRSVQVEFPAVGDITTYFGKGDLKVYVEGYVDGNGQLQLFDRVPNPGW